MQIPIKKMGSDCFYVGEELSKGPRPAFFYFSLSAEESLTLHPYNSPVAYFLDTPVRVFSFTIPGHEEGRGKFHAMEYWAEKMREGENVVFDFLDKLTVAIEQLIKDNVVDPHKMVVGGLSRGAFIATHLAAREKRFSHVLGFAPLTCLTTVEEFSEFEDLVDLDLLSYTENLTHLKALRYYIGNRDTRVDTDKCYTFIRNFAEVVHAKRLQHIDVELILTKSIGHKGHGTSPATFEEGSLWLKQKLLS